MRTRQRFFICDHCKNMLGLVQDKGVPVVCCGEKMKELVANTVDAAKEKHVPEVKIEGDTVNVSVGSVLHPMEEAHHITFIYLETEAGGQRKSLAVGSSPVASFKVVDDKPLAVFEYCNLHGLWKTEI